ncbi:MAG: hypothetical protein HKN91_03885, partial [Acidimicrobiia bacterium]|nr:hypothetical protein [Acidimicrobiia bacterium]
RVDVQGWTETAEEMAIRIGIEKTRYEVKQAAAAQSAAESEEEQVT